MPILHQGRKLCGDKTTTEWRCVFRCSRRPRWIGTLKVLFLEYQIDARNARGLELATFEENRREVGALYLYYRRDKNEFTCRGGGEGTTPVTMACPQVR